MANTPKKSVFKTRRGRLAGGRNYAVERVTGETTKGRPTSFSRSAAWTDGESHKGTSRETIKGGSSIVKKTTQHKGFGVTPEKTTTRKKRGSK